MKQSRTRFLLVSLLAHLIFAAVWLWQSFIDSSPRPNDFGADAVSTSSHYVHVVRDDGRREQKGSTTSKTISPSGSKPTTYPKTHRQEKRLEKPSPTNVAANEPASDTTGADSDDTFAVSMGASEQIRRMPCLIKLHDKIASRVSTNWDLVSGEQVETVSVDVQLEKNGTLKTFDLQTQTTSENASLKSWLRTQLRMALQSPQIGCEFSRSLALKITFHYLQSSTPSPSDSTLSLATPKITGNQLNFYSVKYDPFFIQAHNSLDERGQVINARLESLLPMAVSMFFPMAFGKKTDHPDRAKWDLEYRLAEAVSACENRLAEGACLEAARIDEVSGRKQEALRRYRTACSLGHQLGCQEQSRLEADTGRQISYVSPFQK